MASSGAQNKVPSSTKPNDKVERRRSKSSAKSFSILNTLMFCSNHKSWENVECGIMWNKCLHCSSLCSSEKSRIQYYNILFYSNHKYKKILRLWDPIGSAGSCDRIFLGNKIYLNFLNSKWSWFHCTLVWLVQHWTFFQSSGCQTVRR